MSEPIDNHKEVCRNLSPEGWSYGGFDDGFYFFQSGNYRDGFTEMKLLECDLDKRNIEYMVAHKLTRNDEAIG